jgi:hypothetical protein
LTFTAAELARIYELLWQLVPKPGAVTLAATIRGATRSDIIRAPIDLDPKQSAMLREAMTLLPASE